MRHPRMRCSTQRRVGRLLILGLAFLLPCAFGISVGASPAIAAQDKSFSISNIDVVLDVQKNGDVLVDETMTVAFTGNFHFFAHDIPTANYEGITDIEVRDNGGAVLPEGEGLGTYSAYKQGDMQSIQVNFDLTNATETWTFHYRAKAVVLYGDVDDALEWYVFDAVNPFWIGRARATVRLPESVPSADLMDKSVIDVGYGVYTTVFSSSPSTVVYEASDIPPYTDFWTKTGFPKGVIKFHWTARRVVGFIVPKLGFALPIGTFLIVLLIWMRRGRDQPVQVYAKYVSEPPSALSPGLVGALIDEKVDTKEVMATIVDLARRGYLEIADESGEGLFHKTETTFTRLKSFDDLSGFENEVATSLFDDSHPDQVTTSQLKNHFYTHIPPIVNQIYEDVTNAGLFFKNPKKTRSAWKGYGIALIVVVGVVSFILDKVDIGGWGWLVAGGVISTIVVWLFSSHMPGRTTKGAREQKKWEAFRNYLKDLTRFQDMESAKEKYEQCLPYAMALGVEKDWTRRFEDLAVPSPDWYHPPVVIYDGAGPVGPGGLGGGIGGGIPRSSGGGGGGFRLDDISDGLFGALGKTSNALTSAPSSSSGGSTRGAWSSGGFGGGGFGGGGFSGGGGGGGGFRAG
jgi:hypothetical protein